MSTEDKYGTIVGQIAPYCPKEVWKVGQRVEIVIPTRWWNFGRTGTINKLFDPCKVCTLGDETEQVNCDVEWDESSPDITTTLTHN